ncbi:MAG: galactose mutarotase [Bacteroidales bacterium]|nr:galactose mutarotase [Bacteroidales bacterium]
MKYRYPPAGTILTLFAGLLLAGCHNPTELSEKKQNVPHSVMFKQQPFGTIADQEIILYTLENKNGMIVRLTNFGGIVTSIHLPDRDGKPRDVVLGFDSLHSYIDEHPYFGCIVGRYANRIAHGQFTLDGVSYQLAKNNGENHLHGGPEGFDKKVWQAESFQHGDDAGVILEYLSPDGEEGYPGNLKVRVVYSLTGENELKIDYTAECDAPTPVNLTHHSYFNLNGQGEGDILGHELMINADRYTPVDEGLIPTGVLQDLTGTPMDFRSPKTIGQDFDQVPGGYDHNFVLNKKGGLSLAARLKSTVTGIVMDVLTTQPGLQFYSGNFLDGSLAGKEGKVYQKNYGLCLETQHFPDSPNQPSFPDVILRPGEKFHHQTIYKFNIEAY